jgi:hypothetical protein
MKRNSDAVGNAAGLRGRGGRGRGQAGFSLTEVVVALGLIMATAIPTLGVLSAGLGDARVASNHHVMEALRATVRTCLQDPAWPQAAAAADWSAEVAFHVDGRLAGEGQRPQVGFLAVLTSAPGMGFESVALEAVKVEFYALGSEDLLESCLVQRARGHLLGAVE